MQRYTKGTTERGHILGSLDDVVQTLDDNAMQIQGMSASRFIGPFLNSVQNWEKSLSHISEVLDVSSLSVSVLFIISCLASLKIMSFEEEKTYPLLDCSL